MTRPSRGVAATKPILFSGEMVRAILDNRKTQTRRVLKQKEVTAAAIRGVMGGPPAFVECPYGAVGDRLWVRETWRHWVVGDPSSQVVYRADFATDPGFWRPSIFMPRQHSRLTLEITDVRVERVQDISARDAIAEGIDVPGLGAGSTADKCVERYRKLWDSLNAKRDYSWESNCWVWALTFRRVQACT